MAHVPLSLLPSLPILGTGKRVLPCLTSFETRLKTQSLMITFHLYKRRRAASRKDTQ